LLFISKRKFVCLGSQVTKVEALLAEKGGYFQKLSYGYDGLGEMFEGDTADMCAGKFPLMSMGAERRF
jgi:hypothetical protein